MKTATRPLILALVFSFSVALTNAQIPIYNSFPSASPVLFLDFDGHTIDGTSWNSTGPIYCGGSGLNETQITEVFNRVAEDYRPFTINVTTDSTKFLAAPANHRMRVVVTVTSDWYGSAGGVSFVNSFSWGDNTPCFVFSALLGYNTKNISEATSHEAGHSLGLRHQSSYDVNCVKTSDYNTGVGSGEISWAPIMGVGYSRNLTTWYNGPNSLGCNVYQNDLDVITSAANGITFRSDYQPNNFSTAPIQTFTNNEFTANSIIVKNTYEDYFKFSLSSLKLFQLSAVPFNVGTGNSGANMDLKITLYNSAQAELNTFSSQSSLSVIVDTSLAAGTYYVKVQSVANNFAPNYAMLGSYSVQGQIIETALPLHKLELSGTSDKGRHILNWSVESDEPVVEQTLEISYDGKNFSPLVEPSNEDRSYRYTPEKNASAAYRMHVRLDNNSNHFSNIVIIKQTEEKDRPKLLNSLVTNGTINISSPSVFDFMVYDLNGKVLSRGKLDNGMNSVSAMNMTSGMYLVRYSDGTQQWTEKLVKQ